jgi:pantothenate synthetase
MANRFAKAGKVVSESVELTEKVIQAKAMVSRVRSGVNMVEAGASVGKATTDISLAVSKRDATLAQAELKSILSLMTQMQQMMDMFIASAKDDQEAVSKALQNASDAVQEQAGTDSLIAANTAAPMA